VTPPPQGQLHVEHAGNGARLVLLHGFTQTARCWGPFAADIATDHEIVLVDLPGHGDSADIDADLVGTAGLVADIGERGTLLGYSMGGRVALHVALIRPDAFERMILIGATGGIDDGESRDSRLAADAALADRVEEIGVEAFIDEWLARPMFAGLDAATAARDERLRNTAAGLARSLRRSGTGSQVPLWSQLGNIEMPTLVIVGERDDRFSALGERLVASIGANATMVVIPDAGHSAQLENPTATANAVRTWLAGQPPTNRPTDNITPNTN
jgi:2-succinyl-6-hydroxy-2,4-cyclohexadiene-1-carboxylate synthase